MNYLEWKLFDCLYLVLFTFDMLPNISMGFLISVEILLNAKLLSRRLISRFIRIPKFFFHFAMHGNAYHRHIKGRK